MPESKTAEYVEWRIQKWDEAKAARAAELKDQPPRTISVTLPDGKKVDGQAGVMTALDVANSISKGFAIHVVGAEIDGDQIIDVFRPLEKDCSMKLLRFSDPKGEHIYWHSSAHVLGQAIEQLYAGNARLCIGPPIENGFYYDVKLPENMAVTPADYKTLESSVKKIIKKKQAFERLVLTKEEALEMFKFNKFKLEIIRKKVPDGERCTAYRCGPLIDLCKGPHVPHTGKIRFMHVYDSSGSFWLGNQANAKLQRVYGIAFPDKKQLANWITVREEAKLRDHRKIGVEQKLFFFDTDVAPGMAFWLPHGTIIYNNLVEFIRAEYFKRGFTEVITPNAANCKLFKQSGHYTHYRENMFLFDVEGAEWSLKPMNCPFHCVMFKKLLHSYRDLPIRYADFGVLHRNEYSGALTGLTRVRRFQQDDAHIFCRLDQVEQEIRDALQFLKHVYGVLGFTFNLELSTRPAKYMGQLELWDQAELSLAKCLSEFGQPFRLSPGDGAFYGPKIDVQLVDALGRKHQCATIQLDFQLPIRFDLGYRNEQGQSTRPVIIHRAILGSVERLFAILLEQTFGRWPFWLSPRQAIVIPVDVKYIPYAEKIHQQLRAAGFHCDVADSKNTFKKKIAEAEVMKYNFMLVVGAQEVENQSVTVREHGRKEQLQWGVGALLKKFSDLVSDKTPNHEEEAEAPARSS